MKLKTNNPNNPISQSPLLLLLVSISSLCRDPNLISSLYAALLETQILNAKPTNVSDLNPFIQTEGHYIIRYFELSQKGTTRTARSGGNACVNFENILHAI